MPRNEIRSELDRLRHPFRIAIERAKNPFNIGSIIRTAHSFLVEEILLIGSEPWYERAAMGMQRYENIVELPDEAAFIERAQRESWRLVAFEKDQADVGLYGMSSSGKATSLIFGNGVSLQRRLPGTPFVISLR